MKATKVQNNLKVQQKSQITLKWREAITKEFDNMEKNHILRVIKKMDVPENRRLLGAKWVFKVKKRNLQS